MTEDDIDIDPTHSTERLKMRNTTDEIDYVYENQ